MAKYHLVHTESKGTFFNLTRLEMVNKLKQASDLKNWFCWYPGIIQWKQVSQAKEVREWMAHTWTEDQSMPAWQGLLTTGVVGESQDFEVVEFNDSPATPLPPPLPPEQKTEFVVSGFSGQVFDFDESLKDKHLNSTDFKILNKDDKNTDDSNKFESTVKVDTTATDFENTHNGIAAVVPENTSKININEIEPVTGRFENVSDMTVTEEVPISNKTENAVAGNNTSKKHNRRYPRINGRLRTIITNKSKAFMTFTKDISLGGIQVENNIPQDILNSEIEVYVSDPSGKKSILFRCHPVGDTKNPCRFSFAKADEKNLQKLGQWIDDLVKTSAA